MSADTTRLVTTLTNTDVEATLSSLSTALGLDSILGPAEPMAPDDLVAPGAASGNVHDRFWADLRQLQADEATFLADPAQAAEFELWLRSFNPDDVKSAISDLLIDNSSMRLLYSQLVTAISCLLRAQPIDCSLSLSLASN